MPFSGLFEVKYHESVYCKLIILIIVSYQGQGNSLAFLIRDSSKLIYLAVLDYYKLLFRYYLLHVAKANNEIDMPKLAKISCVAVWMIEFIFLLLCQLPAIISLLMIGWPRRGIQDIVNTNFDILMKMLFATVLLANVPDFISIVLYIKMFLLARKNVQPVLGGEDLPFGGIWVGDDDSQVVAALNAQLNQANQDKIRAILKMLRWNAVFCLLDMAGGVVWNQLVCKGTLALITAYTYQTLVCFWIPTLILASNFKWTSCCTFCCTHDNIFELVC